MLFARDERTTRRGRGLLVVGAIQAHWPEDGAKLKGTGARVARKKTPLNPLANVDGNAR
jgi:hypothetical protein